MTDFTVRWLDELRKRIERAQRYSATHPISERQRRTLEEMKRAAAEK